MNWKPISELPDRYAADLLLRARELVSPDFNPSGVAPGHWQDGGKEGDDADDGAWLAARWCNNCEAWHVVTVHPTHFCVIEGPVLADTVAQ